MQRGRRTVVLVLVGVLAVVILGGLGYLTLGGQNIPQKEVVPALVPVVVALQPLAAGETLTAEQVGIDLREATSIPSGAVTRLQDVMGYVLGRTLDTDEIVLITDLATSSEGGSQAAPGSLDGELGTDWVAVAIQAPDLWSQWGIIQPGDHLDVLAMIELSLEPEPSLLPPSPFATTTISLAMPTSEQVILWTIQDLEVLRVVEEPQEETPAAEGEALPFAPVARRLLVLKAAPQDGAILQYLEHTEATIDLVLRARQNSRRFDVDSVTLDYLLRRYSPDLGLMRP